MASMRYAKLAAVALVVALLALAWRLGIFAQVAVP